MRLFKIYSDKVGSQVKAHYECHNRGWFKRTLSVQDGYKQDGTRNMIEVPFVMSQSCEYTRSELGAVDERCGDCQHKIRNKALNEMAELNNHLTRRKSCRKIRPTYSVRKPPRSDAWGFCHF